MIGQVLEDKEAKQIQNRRLKSAVSKLVELELDSTELNWPGAIWNIREVNLNYQNCSMQSRQTIKRC